MDSKSPLQISNNAFKLEFTPEHILFQEENIIENNLDYIKFTMIYEMSNYLYALIDNKYLLPFHMRLDRWNEMTMHIDNTSYTLSNNFELVNTTKDELYRVIRHYKLNKETIKKFIVDYLNSTKHKLSSLRI